MITGDDVVLQARRWLGTPFHHQGRVRGAGADCAGLLIGVLHELELSAYDIDGYAMLPDGAMLAAECNKVMRRLQPGEPVQPGDALLLRMGRMPQHLGIVSAVEAGVPAAMVHIHSHAPSFCVEHRLDARWRRRIVCVYRFRGVEG